MSMLNKICICLCCSGTACNVGECYDCWTAVQACGLAQLQCSACCWTICAPICHTCSLGDVGKGLDHCVTGLKYCVFSCLLQCVSPFDGCINCILYQKENCTNGVSGFADVTKNTMFIGGRIKDALNLSCSNQPERTFKTYTP